MIFFEKYEDEELRTIIIGKANCKWYWVVRIA
jgi:hypothetical protein